MLASFRAIFEQKDNELDSLNGFRTLSVLGILVHHYWEAVRHSFLGKSDLVDFIDRIPLNMNSVMDLFFMLSGFLISGGLWLDWKKTGTIHFGKYFARRTFRIFPLYYILFFISLGLMNFQIAVMSKQTLDPNGQQILDALKASRANWWTDVLFISNYFGNTHVVAHAWSLALEEQFYTILPIVGYLFLFRLSTKARLTTLGALYFVPLCFRILHVSNWGAGGPVTYFTYLPTHTRADSLIVGIIIMDLYFNVSAFRDWIAKRSVRLIGLIGAAALLVWAHLIPYNPNLWMRAVFGYNLQNIGFGILICLSLHPTSRLAQILSARIHTPMARVSYGMYMWQGIAGSAGMALVLRGLDLDKLTPAQAATGFIVGTLFTFGAGILSWMFIEHPFMRLRTRLAGGSPDLKHA